ncbi:hypothetical protein OIU92_27875 [Escherichia coli]|nr:hypothetical protein [Escherichia coli]
MLDLFRTTVKSRHCWRVVLLFVLPGFRPPVLGVQTLTMVYSSAQILILLAMGATLCNAYAHN